MERNFYFVGIAFFGMVNGLFNQVALLFALLHVQVLAPALLFGSVLADADVLILDGLDRGRSSLAASRLLSTSALSAPSTIRPWFRFGSGWRQPVS